MDFGAAVFHRIAAVSAFYAHQARNGADVGDLLAAWKAGGRGGWNRSCTMSARGSRIAAG